MHSDPETVSILVSFVGLDTYSCAPWHVEEREAWHAVLSGGDSPDGEAPARWKVFFVRRFCREVVTLGDWPQSRTFHCVLLVSPAQEVQRLFF